MSSVKNHRSTTAEPEKQPVATDAKSTSQPEAKPKTTWWSKPLTALKTKHFGLKANPVPTLDKQAHVFTIDHLSFYYGSKQALKDISFIVHRRQVTALIGPSGCGKSTFLRCLNRMNDLIAGSKVKGKVLFYSNDIYDSGFDVINLRARVGMVFQRPNPFPMSIYDNVAFGLKSQGIRNKKFLDQVVAHALKRAALWDEVKDHLKSSALSLSGGQQQRLCIARAIAMEPEVLLMDEPTSALDPIATARIEQLIDELKHDYTIVIVTHSMQQAGRISDQTAFFLNGELIEINDTKKLFLRPKDKRTEDYITGRFG